MWFIVGIFAYRISFDYSDSFYRLMTRLYSVLIWPRGDNRIQFEIRFFMMTLKRYTMDIQAKIDELNKRKAEIEEMLYLGKEEIKKINIQGRKLQTILKHAEAALNDQEEPEPAEHPEA